MALKRIQAAQKPYRQPIAVQSSCRQSMSTSVITPLATKAQALPCEHQDMIDIVNMMFLDSPESGEGSSTRSRDLHGLLLVGSEVLGGFASTLLKMRAHLVSASAYTYWQLVALGVKAWSVGSWGSPLGLGVGGAEGITWEASLFLLGRDLKTHSA